jgi:hypothetical protein
VTHSQHYRQQERTFAFHEQEVFSAHKLEVRTHYIITINVHPTMFFLISIDEHCVALLVAILIVVYGVVTFLGPDAIPPLESMAHYRLWRLLVCLCAHQQYAEKIHGGWMGTCTPKAKRN